MLKLIIEDDEGRKTVVPFVRDEITIGRQDGNTIRLTERNVSRRHARLVRQNGHVLIEDLGSYNGTRINGERIQGQSEIQDGDLIQIGDYDLALQAEGAATASAPPRAAPRRGEDAGEEDSADDITERDDEHDETPPPAAVPRERSTAVIRMDQVETNRSRKVQELDPEKAPRLVGLTAEFKGQEFSCIRTEMRIGRGDENDIPLDHRSVSSTHAKLVREDTGEWRIIDMQSANGLTVNGESYAQATLHHGDLIELGHVKLRFVGVGKAVGSLSVGGRSKLPLVVGALVVLALLGAGVFILKSRPAPVPPPDGKPAQQQARGPEPVKPSTTTSPAVQDTPPAPPKVVEAPPAPAGIPQLAEKLQGAQDAIKERRFDQAVDILESIKDSRGARPPEAERLLDQSRAELLAKKFLAQASKELDAGKLDAAGNTLDAVATMAYDKELAELRSRLEAARATPQPGPGPRSPKNNRPEDGAADPSQLLANAKQLLKGRQFQEATTLLEQCIAKEPANAECHLRLGVAYANLKFLDKGADHYRQFLNLVPADHPQADKVRALVEAYENKKEQAATNK